MFISVRVGMGRNMHCSLNKWREALVISALYSLVFPLQGSM